MLEIGGKPLLWHIMNSYAQHGLTDFVLCLGYRGDVIRRYFRDYQVLNDDFTVRLGQANGPEFINGDETSDWSVTLVNTGELAMTGARVKRIEQYVGNDDFLLTYGDGLSNVDITASVAFHKSHGKIGTVTGVHPPSRFGELIIDGQQVIKFSEKPQTGEGWINGGFFVFSSEMFSYVDDDDECVLERGPLEKLASDGQLQAFNHDDFWLPIDTQRDLDVATELWNGGDAPWR